MEGKPRNMKEGSDKKVEKEGRVRRDSEGKAEIGRKVKKERQK